MYRYDLVTRKLSYVAQVGGDKGKGGGEYVSLDGNDFYFVSSGVAGIPNTKSEFVGAGKALGVYRFDAEAGVVQCMSCASSFNPEPGLDSYFLYGQGRKGDAQPALNIASENGDFVFFDSTAELVPQDVDGEVPADPTLSSEHVEFVRSPSSDTYEWRKDGIDGCSEPQGCLSLITGGRGGYRNELLGASASGGDVFFVTHEKLVAQDQDTAGDIYDARIDGGFPGPAPRPVECEGDACSTPASPPVDSTPASLVFSGSGNLAPAPGAPAITKSKPKPKKKVKLKRKRAKKEKVRSRAKKSSHTNRRAG